MGNRLALNITARVYKASSETGINTYLSTVMMHEHMEHTNVVHELEYEKRDLQRYAKTI